MGPKKSKTGVTITYGRRRKKTTLESVDRISALPDSILCVILSLLPTKDALATSTLSKRWEFVWRTVRNLDFCLEVGWGRTEKQIEKINEKFVGLVNHILLHHDAGILNKFRLVWTPYCIQSHATSWIETAITRSVRKLSLTLQSFDEEYCYDQEYCEEPFDIRIFSCESLQSLKLKGPICLSAPNVLCLPRLESLKLCEVSFECTDAFKNLIRGCPMLIYLHIYIDEYTIVGEDVNLDNAVGFEYNIASTSLRRLELHTCPCDVKLDASSLEVLKIYGDVSVKFKRKQLRSVIEADLGGSEYVCDSVVKLVNALRCAKTLTLSCKVMTAISRFGLNTDFKRLVKLEAHIYYHDWGSLQDIIQCSNNLQVLIIEQSPMSGDVKTKYGPSNWTTPMEVPICLSTSLKKVVFRNYYGYEEREMIRYMLKHGSFLEVVQISCDGKMNKYHRNFEFLQQICEFTRKSSACAIKFSGETESATEWHCKHPTIAIDYSR